MRHPPRPGPPHLQKVHAPAKESTRRASDLGKVFGPTFRIGLHRTSNTLRSNSRKVINTTPDVWRRESQLAAIAKRGLHEIVVRFSDRQPLRLRGFDGEANAEQAAQMMMGEILSGISANISLRTAVGYIILPDGHGPEGVEEVDVTKL